MITGKQLILPLGGVSGGLLIYLLYRSTGLLGHRLLSAIGWGSEVEALRSWAQGLWIPPPFVVYCLPDGLWTLSYVLIIHHLLRNDSRRKRMLIAAIIPAVGITSELLQLLGIMPGTWDVMDLLCYIIPYFVIFLL